MITGAHFLLYSNEPEADRAFIRDVLGFRSVDAGDGWLIFRLPPAEVAVHPAAENFVRPDAGHELFGAVLYLMCDDLRETVRSLSAKNVECAPLDEQRWGTRTSIRLPSGGAIGLYQPTHPTAIGIDSA
jgi:hypothetical protein